MIMMIIIIIIIIIINCRNVLLKHFEGCLWVGTAQSVKRLATVWTFRGLNPGGGEIFRTRPDRPWGPPSLPYNEYRVFPGVERPGRGVDHPPHLAPRLKKE
jgi:hypothetical protein